MKVAILTLFLFFAAVNCNLFLKEENGVFIVDDKSINNAIQFYDNIIIDFYTGWCGKCTRFMPIFEKACAKLRKLDKPVYCAKIDMDVNKKSVESFNIVEYPTIIYFNGTEQVKYEGAQKEHSLRKWIETGEMVNSLPVDLKELDEFKDSEHVFFTYFGPAEGKDFFLWNMLAKYDEFRMFTHTNDKDAIEKYNVKTPTVVAFRHFDEPIVQLEGGIERTNVMNFLREKGKAKCMYFSEIDKLNIFRAKDTAVFLIADPVRNSHLIDTFCTVAKQDDSPLMYAWVDVNNKEQDSLREYINVHERQSPILAMVTFEVAYGMMRFEYDGEVKALTEKDLKGFIKRFRSGALERHYYDDQAKTWYHLKAPHTIIYDNYEQIVMDKDNDVVVYYHGSTSIGGDAKNYHKVYNQLSEEIGRPDNLIVGRYEWHKAPPVEHPNAEPHKIVIYPKGDKEKGVVYGGEDNIEKLREFLQDNSSVYRELNPTKEDL